MGKEDVVTRARLAVLELFVLGHDFVVGEGRGIGDRRIKWLAGLNVGIVERWEISRMEELIPGKLFLWGNKFDSRGSVTNLLHGESRTRKNTHIK